MLDISGDVSEIAICKPNKVLEKGWADGEGTGGSVEWDWYGPKTA
jgi:hypothetical protein